MVVVVVAACQEGRLSGWSLVRVFSSLKVAASLAPFLKSVSWEEKEGQKGCHCVCPPAFALGTE